MAKRAKARRAAQGNGRRAKASALEELRSTRAERNRLRWTELHPAAAAAERAMRKARDTSLKRWDHKNDGTPETHEHVSRANEGALRRLYMSGAIDGEQLNAAVEIATVSERIGADVAVRTASLETRIDAGRQGEGRHLESISRVRHEVAYTRWRGLVRGPLGAVLDMIVGEPVGYTVAARRYRISAKRAKALLIEALDLWPTVLEQAVREIDRATWAAAEAGIL